MKQLILAFAAMFICITEINAQKTDFFNKQLRIKLMNFLTSIETVCQQDYFSSASNLTGNDEQILSFDNFPIINLLTMERVDMSDDMYEYGIYSFGRNEVHNPKHILLKKGNEYKILRMNDWVWKNGTGPGLITFEGAKGFEEIILELFQYFKDNPDVNPELMPLYTNAVFTVFFENYHTSFSPSICNIKDEYKRILSGNILFHSIIFD